MWGAGKRVDGVFTGRSQSFRHQRRPVGGRKKSGWGVSWTISELSASTPTSGRLQPRTRGNGAERQNKGRNIFMAKWIVADRTKVRLRHAVVCPDVTGRTKKRIAQSKRARAGSLALVDYPQVS